MKNCYLLWAIYFLFCLTAQSDQFLPGNHDFQPASSEVTIDGQVFHHFTEGSFELLFDTRSANEIPYCAEIQWDEAKAYYENPDHFTYYCLSGLTPPTILCLNFLTLIRTLTTGLIPCFGFIKSVRMVFSLPL